MNAKPKTVVLLSGGQDSATSLFWAKHRLLGAGELHALSMFYGQRHQAELEAAKTIAELAGCASHEVWQVDALMGGPSALTDMSRDIAAEGGMPDKAMPQGLPSTFVPGRNLVFLALAAAYAGRIGASFIVTGVCQTDYSGYPDCRLDFVHAMQNAIAQAWPQIPGAPLAQSCPMIRVPLMRLTKCETVRLMVDLASIEFGANEAFWTDTGPFRTKAWEALAHSITCYRGERPGCGTCPACDLRAKGFAEAGIKDPAHVRWSQLSSQV